MEAGRLFTIRLGSAALRVVAWAAAAMAALELARAGIRWGPLGKPMTYHFAAVAAVAVALRAVIVRQHAWRPIGAAALALALYLSNDQRLMSGDTQPAALIPYALIRHGTLALDEVVPAPDPAWVLRARGHVWSQYPITTGILALPVYLPAALGPGAPGQSHAEKVAAASLAAASVGFVVALLLRLGVSGLGALLAAAAYALGSPVASVAAQALWQHTGGVLAFAGALYSIVRAREDRRAEPWAGFFLGLAVASRPTSLFAAAALGLVASAPGRRSAWRVAWGAAIPVALVGVYQWVAFGAPWRTGYAGEAHAFGFGAHVLAGLAGTLVSPTRGLLTYVPWAVLALLGLWRGARREPLHGAALVGVASIVAIHACWNDWPGGWGYGPRLVTDATPLLVLGLVPILQAPRRRWAAPAVAALVVLAIWLAWLGAFREYEPPARDVYLGGDVHAMEWWRYPPVAILGRR